MKLDHALLALVFYNSLLRNVCNCIAKGISLGAEEGQRGQHAWSSFTVSYSLDDSQTSWDTAIRANEREITIFGIKIHSARAIEAEWLRRWTRNSMGFSRTGLNPVNCEIIFVSPWAISNFFISSMSLLKRRWTKFYSYLCDVDQSHMKYIEKYGPFVTFFEFKTKDLFSLRILFRLCARPI